MRQESACGSRGAAAYVSPGRKPWVSAKIGTSPVGTAESLACSCSVAALLSFLLGLSALCAAQTSARFLGPPANLSPPDGRYILLSTDDLAHHAVFLKDTRTGRVRKVYQYERSAAVLWSPDSRHFAVDDFEGSNIAEAYIFSTDEPTLKIDLQDHLLRQGGLRPSGGHDYFGVSRWLDPSRVVVHYWGHSDDPPASAFCECYVFNLNGAIKKCAQQSAARDPEGYCWSLMPNEK
jgi:hypothetical protein